MTERSTAHGSACPQAAVAAPRSVLIVRLSAVGDCIQTAPVACALRERFPEIRITWVVEKAAAPLVSTLAEVDRVVVIPKRLLYSLSVIRQVRSELHRESYDLALDPQSLTKSGVVAWLSGACRRYSFARPAGREISPWLSTHVVESRSPHMVDRYLELLRPLGIEAPRVRFGIQIPAAANHVAEELLERRELQGGYVAINPGAGWDSKRWLPERYAEVASQLARGGIRSVVVWGGSKERQLADEIVEKSSGAAILAPPTTLLELAGVLRSARMFLGSDTGPMHLAAALGTPCVALFGASQGAACGPYGPGHRVVQAAFDGSRGRKRPGADNWAMRGITAGMALDACDELLSRQRKPLPGMAVV